MGVSALCSRVNHTRKYVEDEQGFLYCTSLDALQLLDVSQSRTDVSLPYWPCRRLQDFNIPRNE